MNSADLAILENDSWFGSLPADRRAIFIGQARLSNVAAGGRIYSIGDPPNGMWAVLEGQVRLKGYPTDGMEFLALILRPGTWFGETSTLDGKSRPHDAIAFESTRLLHIPMPTFKRLAAENPELYRDLGLLLCYHQRLALRFIAQTIAQPVRVRLARTLLGQAHGGRNTFMIGQDELAIMVGVSRQTINKQLSLLKHEEVVVLAYGRVTIRDLQRLTVIAKLNDG